MAVIKQKKWSSGGHKFESWWILMELKRAQLGVDLSPVSYSDTNQSGSAFLWVGYTTPHAALEE